MDSPDLIADGKAVDAWADLRRFTDARIALGRSGGSLRSPTLLDFRLSHARAKDAVQMAFDADALCAELIASGMDYLRLSSAVTDRQTYLLRPDLGRRLSEESVDCLGELSDSGRSAWDIVIIISDGLSALASSVQALPTVRTLHHHLCAMGWRVGPLLVIPYARVKLQDEVGEILGVRHTLMLLGERPGLGAPDSLGAYFTYRPNRMKTDADRNCVSNIRPAGFPPEQAAIKLTRLLAESARRELSGVSLKDRDLPSLHSLIGESKAEKRLELP